MDAAAALVVHVLHLILRLMRDISAGRARGRGKFRVPARAPESRQASSDRFGNESAEGEGQAVRADDSPVLPAIPRQAAANSDRKAIRKMSVTAVTRGPAPLVPDNAQLCYG